MTVCTPASASAIAVSWTREARLTQLGPARARPSVNGEPDADRRKLSFNKFKNIEKLAD